MEFQIKNSKHFKCFDAIYIINLPERKDRRDEIASELKNVGISLHSEGVILFPAVRPDSTGPFPSIGARGCFLSHLGVLEDAASKGYMSFLILEDDCNLTNDWEERIKNFSRSYPNDAWDLFYGGTLSNIELSNQQTGFALVDPNINLIGSHCLAINHRTLPLLIEYLNKMLTREEGDPDGGPMHVDGAYSWFRRAHPSLKTLIATPEIAYQRSSKTDIHNLKWFDRIKILEPAIHFLRKAKNLLRQYFQ